MRIEGIQRTEVDGQVELRANVRFDTHWVWGDDPFPLWYRVPAEHAGSVDAGSGDPFLAAWLVPALLLGEPLSIEAPVSPRVLEGARLVQAVHRSWDPALPEIDLEVPVRPMDRAPRPAAEALFFSLGMDSAYSLWRRRETVTHLVVVEGFDVYLWEAERWPPMLAAARGVADHLGKALVPVTTNLREATDRIADWPRRYFGSALASVGLALGPAFGGFAISAGTTWDDLFPNGGHPLVDPLWSTERTEFFQVGLDADRIDKARALASDPDPVWLRDLRVCATSEVTDEYNCGRCEKCLRTMLCLRLVGGLERCQTLPHVIDPELVRGMRPHTVAGRRAIQDLLAAGIDEPWRSALAAVLDDEGGDP